MEEIIAEIRRLLAEEASLETKKKSQRFFKEELKSYGVPNPVVHNIAKTTYKILDSSNKQEIFAICESLFQSGYNEEAIIAADWTFYTKRKFDIADIYIFKQWIDAYINNWASCDTFCTKSIGYIVDRFPDAIDELKRWTTSDNRWVRRAAAVSLVAPARRGKFLPEILDIADLLLNDEDDMVQKGYGWMLKEASKPHRQEIFEFVMEHKRKMPRTSLRYAIEKMPREYKELAMA